MKRDALSAILPTRRFISIHPDLLDIMGYHEAALLHEVRWRANAQTERGDDEWVRLLPDEWQRTLHLTTKQVRRAIDACLDAGWLEAERQGDSWDRCRSLRIVVESLAVSLQGADRSALEGDSMRPGGQLTSALEGDSSMDEEPLEEGLSLHALDTYESGENDPGLTVADATTTDLPPIAADPPPEQSLQSEAPLVHVFRYVEGGVEVERRMLVSLLPEMVQRDLGYLPAAAEPVTDVPASNAPSIGDESGRHQRIRTARVLEIALQRGWEWVPRAQADHRNLAKLLDLRPTFAQLDGALGAMGATSGNVDLGRLVQKWSTLSQFAAPRPKGWESKRTKDQDAHKAHIAATGNAYSYDGAVDYGL